MIKVAFIKFCGLASGGTEKYLQTLACLLPKNKYDIDYFYSNNAPLTIDNGFIHPDNDPEREKLMKNNGINLIPFNIQLKDSNRPCEWYNTNFWDVFKEKNYNVIQTARGGYPEYPFNVINNCPIIDSIHSFNGEDKPNIKKSILLCKWQAEKWASDGGDIKKAVIIPSIVRVPEKKPSTIRKRLNIPENAFVYGFHQASRSDIFSPVSLQAYSMVQNENTHFVILGGCSQHIQTAKQLNIKNIHFIQFTSSVDGIHDFLAGIDVYAHARADGEVCSASIIEAMYHGKPIITHPALNMGHLEQISDCGKMAYSLNEYVEEMKLLKNNRDYYMEKKEKTILKYNTNYDYKIVEKNIISIYDNLFY